jgi:hypothetical protein
VAVTINNKKLKDHAPVFRVIPASNFGIHFKGSRTNIETETSIQGLHSNRRKIHRSERLHYSKPLDLSYKGASPRADTEIQSLLLPKGSNPDTFREEKACCKKICMIRNIANPLLAPALLPDMFCNKNNAISPEDIEGETTKTSTQRMAPTDRKRF